MDNKEAVAPSVSNELLDFRVRGSAERETIMSTQTETDEYNEKIESLVFNGVPRSLAPRHLALIKEIAETLKQMQGVIVGYERISNG